jgi:hypothetical protein
VISWPHRHFWRCGTTRSTIISGHIGHSRNTNKPHPYQTQPAPFWRDFFALPLRSTINMSARQAANGYDPLPAPFARACSPPRLRAKPTSFCALCADRQAPPAGAAWKKRCFKNCANLCIFASARAYFYT